MNDDRRIYFNYLWDAKTLEWTNFLNYFQTKNNAPVEFVARTIDGAFHEYDFDTMLYAKRRQR